MGFRLTSSNDFNLKMAQEGKNQLENTSKSSFKMRYSKQDDRQNLYLEPKTNEIFRTNDQPIKVQNSKYPAMTQLQESLLLRKSVTKVK